MKFDGKKSTLDGVQAPFSMEEWVMYNEILSDRGFVLIKEFLI